MNYRTLLLLGLISATATPALAQTLVPGQRLQANDPNGVYCREYQQSVVIGGVRRQSYGTACQQPDGDWKIVSSDQQVPANSAVEYIEEPIYTSPPRYVVPPVAYYESYETYPYYYEPYPYYRSYPHSSFSFGVDIGGGHSRHGHGSYHHGGSHGRHH